MFLDAVELLGALLGGVGRRRHDPGVVVRQVEPPVRLHGPVDGGGDLGLVGDVAAQREGLVPGVGQFPRGGGDGPLVEVGEGHGGAGLREGQAVARPMPEPAPVTKATCPPKS